MIVRETLTNPYEILPKFDFFNDYQDTKRFLSCEFSRRAIVISMMLEAAYHLWIMEREENRKDRSKHICGND